MCLNSDNSYIDTLKRVPVSSPSYKQENWDTEKYRNLPSHMTRSGEASFPGRQAGMTSLHGATAHNQPPPPGPRTECLPFLLPPEHVGLLDSQDGGSLPSLQTHFLWCPFRHTSVFPFSPQDILQSSLNTLLSAWAFFAKLLQEVYILLVSLQFDSQERSRPSLQS